VSGTAEPAPAWRDNVPRRKSFEAANPDLEISYDRDESRWRASGRLSDGRQAHARSRELGELLDRLGAP
jgi:hypothetical protein